MEDVGIARTNIVRIEAKKNVPTIEVLIKLATAIDMELDDYICITDIAAAKADSVRALPNKH